MHVLLSQWMRTCYSSLLTDKLPILTIEEAVLQGGFGSAVLEYAHDQGFYDAIIDQNGDS